MLTTLFWISFLLFLSGIAVKIWSWFRWSLEGRESFSSRFYGFLRGLKGVFGSRKAFLLLKAFFSDVLLQLRTYRLDRYRWLMHLLIYWGFGLLVVTHGFGKVVFGEYVSTLMPHIFLRDLFGLLVLVGAFMALWRRWVRGVRFFASNRMDVYALLIVALVVLSGFLLKAVKVTSYKAYSEMVEQYAALEQEELKALEAYWVKEMGLVSPNANMVDEALLARGAEVHAVSCAPCHAAQQWAFVSYGISRAFKPFALPLDRINGAQGLWWVHIGALLVALSLLPFTKFLHLITVPLSLLLNAVMSREVSRPENMKTKQMIELEACVHCGTCTSGCAVGMASFTRSNQRILPSEKIAPIRLLVQGKGLGQRELQELLEGVWLCTNCLKCTVVCPSGIDLQELWFQTREALFRKGVGEPLVLSPLSFYRGLRAGELDGGYKTAVLRIAERLKEEFRPGGEPFEAVEELSPMADGRFWPCFSCQTCTNVCPVVALYERPEGALGLLPHQLMRACALGLKELALSAEMLWKCLACYQCQELCPQGVEVTEVMMELKAMALASLKEAKDAVRLVSGL